VRFAAKLGFKIDAACEAPLFTQGRLLEGVPAARLFDEVLKLFLAGTGLHAFEKLRHYDLFGCLFHQTDASLTHEENAFPITLVHQGLENTDTRVREGKPVTPAFLFAFLLWEPVRELAERLLAQGRADTEMEALQQAGAEVTARQVRRIALPKRFSLPMREIWQLQPRFAQRGGKRPQRFVGHPRFRAAYDFMLLRAHAGEVEQELAEWWSQFQELDEEGRSQSLRGTGGPRKRRRRRRPQGQPVATVD